ncbi:MAG: hypothetical protein RQ758_04245 [Methanomicrobiaceae archaeon]|nr:hypothetical protein [Methanomicrobiaceae archaeon]
MPEARDEEVGRRVFAIQKEKAVELAVEKIRQNLGKEWKLYSGSEKETLRNLLGRTWISTEREVWERCAFSRMTRKDLDELITIGEGFEGHSDVEEVLDRVRSILARLS